MTSPVQLIFKGELLEGCALRWSLLRLHDLDRGEWWLLTMFVPALNAGVQFILWFWPDAVLAARAAFAGEYAQARAHKAFALSSSGAWGMKFSAASPEEAIAGAVASCDALRPPESSPCKTINLNGQGSRSP